MDPSHHKSKVNMHMWLNESKFQNNPNILASVPELLITNSNGYIDHNLTCSHDAQPKVQTLYEKGLDQGLKVGGFKKRIWDGGGWHFDPKLVPIWLDPGSTLTCLLRFWSWIETRIMTNKQFLRIHKDKHKHDNMVYSPKATRKVLCYVATTADETAMHAH
jgi:hypothetical protein